MQSMKWRLWEGGLCLVIKRISLQGKEISVRYIREALEGRFVFDY